MKRTPLGASAVLLSLVVSACLGLPEENETSEPAGSTAVTATSVAGSADTRVESGTESPVSSVVTTPGTPVTEDTNAAQTLAGCPEIPALTIDLENPIPDTATGELVGLTEKTAVACAESEGWGVRVVQRDGEEFMVTADYRADRVNLVIEDDVVTSVTVG
jgi:hypothetical protein